MQYDIVKNINAYIKMSENVNINGIFFTIIDINSK